MKAASVEGMERRSALVETIRFILDSKGREIWSVAPDSSVYDAIALMAEKSVGALVVISAGKLAGIVSERDYARKVILKGRSSHETRVHEIMTAPVVTATPQMTVDDCMRIMTEHRIRHLPVQESDNLVGMVSIGDLVKSIIASQAQTIDHLTDYIKGKYPG